MQTRLELNEPAVPASVRPIRHRVMQAAREAGATDSVVDDIGLCVGEAAANAATHAYEGERGTIGVLVQADELNLTVTVRDRGSGVGRRGEMHGSSAPTDRAPGEERGFGLRIIEELARDTSVWSAPGRGTVVRMQFSLEAPRTRQDTPPRHARR